MESFANWTQVIREYPNAAFEKISQGGFELYYRNERSMSDPDWIDLHVRASIENHIVACAEFSDDGRIAYCQNATVDEKHRRKGIGNAMYVFAEKVLGKPLTNFWKGNPEQSPEAIMLWNNPNRPFGHHVS